MACPPHSIALVATCQVLKRSATLGAPSRGEVEGLLRKLSNDSEQVLAFLTATSNLFDASTKCGSQQMNFPTREDCQRYLWQSQRDEPTAKELMTTIWNLCNPKVASSPAPPPTLDLAPTVAVCSLVVCARPRVTHRRPSRRQKAQRSRPRSTIVKSSASLPARSASGPSSALRTRRVQSSSGRPSNSSHRSRSCMLPSGFQPPPSLPSRAGVSSPSRADVPSLIGDTW